MKDPKEYRFSVPRDYYKGISQKESLEKCKDVSELRRWANTKWFMAGTSIASSLGLFYYTSTISETNIITDNSEFSYITSAILALYGVWKVTEAVSFETKMYEARVSELKEKEKSLENKVNSSGDNEWTDYD